MMPYVWLQCFPIVPMSRLMKGCEQGIYSAHHTTFNFRITGLSSKSIVCLNLYPSPAKVCSHACTAIDWTRPVVVGTLHSAITSRCQPDGDQSTTKAIDNDMCCPCLDRPKRFRYAACLKSTVSSGHRTRTADRVIT